MRHLLAGLLIGGAALSGCERAPYVKQPPKAYQTNTTAMVRFEDTQKVWNACDRGPSVVGCARGVAITMPNPCQWPDDETYAQLLCHEMAHVNGWPANHPEG